MANTNALPRPTQISGRESSAYDYDDVCHAVVFLASDQSPCITGPALSVTGGAGDELNRRCRLLHAGDNPNRWIRKNIPAILIHTTRAMAYPKTRSRTAGKRRADVKSGPRPSHDGVATARRRVLWSFFNLTGG
ncbi:MAG: hypothetical protein ABSA69_06350 [Verrucomicrobiota bacterium]|jgi:hypothetical protein